MPRSRSTRRRGSKEKGGLKEPPNQGNILKHPDVRISSLRKEELDRFLYLVNPLLLASERKLHERAKKLFTYDPINGQIRTRSTGKLWWSGKGQYVSVAPWVEPRIRMPGHRFAVFYIMGHTLPSHLFIDHINGERHNNTLRNLRIVDAAENARNKECHREGLSGAEVSEYYERLRKYRVGDP